MGWVIWPGLWAGCSHPPCPATLAYVADTGTPERSARRFAWMSVASLLGFLAGPAAAGWLSGVAMAMPSGTMVRSGAVWLPFLLAAVIGFAVGKECLLKKKANLFLLAAIVLTTLLRKSGRGYWREPGKIFL